MNRTRILISVLLLSILITAVMPSVSAVEKTYVTQLKFSNMPGNDWEMCIEGKTLTIKNLPKTERFNFYVIWLEDNAGTEYNKTYMENKDDPGYSLDNLADGTYYVQMYTSPERYGTYWSYIWGTELSIKIENGKGEFEISPAYTINSKIYNSKKTTKNALDFYKKPSRGIQSDDKEIISLATSITKDITSDYDKAKAIHDWVANNIWYDWDVFTGKAEYGDTSAVGTLKSKRSVCQGYASLNAALLRAAGIPAKLVSGYALGAGGSAKDFLNESKSNHAWNEAFVDGRWIIIDTTWDSGNEYENGVYSSGTGLRYYKYFDITLMAFSYDHRISDYSEKDIPEQEKVAQPEKVTALPAAVTVIVNGVKVDFEAYDINGNNYFKLRDLAMALNGTSKQFGITYDAKKNSIMMSSGSAYSPVGGELKKSGSMSKKEGTLTKSAIYLDGVARNFMAYNISDNNFFKLRDVMEALNIYVGWDNATKTITLDTSKDYQP